MRIVFALFYKYLCKPIFFKIDPEKVHDGFMRLGALLGKVGFAKAIFGKLFIYENRILNQEICGIEFLNPIGVPGGFDKNAILTEIMPSVGVGFHEVGSITAKEYEGNPKPRLQRFPKTRSLWVNYGLKNLGARKIHQNLENVLKRNGGFKIPIFFNIAKTNCKETADSGAAVLDYCESMKIFADMAAAFTVNISCPNAFGGQPFHHPEDLEALLSEMDKLKLAQPIFLKISPDISDAQTNELLKICDAHKVDGIIISNLRKKKVEEDFDPSERGSVSEHGGLSGKYLEPFANHMLKYVATKIKHGECRKYVLVGVGGIFDANDAYRKIRLGASLVQLITGMIFEGPQVIGAINEGLVKLMKRDGFKNISEVVGVDIV